MKSDELEQIIVALDSRDVDVCVAAAGRLHAEADADDLPRLKLLLGHENFFVREAAAWPLSELAGPPALPELFVAYQRGFDEGLDNDGFTAALIEMAAFQPAQTKSALLLILADGNDSAKENAKWLLEFCEESKS